MKKEIIEDRVVPTTIRVYKNDIEKFRKYVSNTEGETQKQCFRELVKILEKMNESQENTIYSFWTYIKNDFNPEKKRDAQYFSILGKLISSVVEDNQIICDEDNKCKVIVNRFDSDRRGIENIDGMLDVWNKAINDEFDMNLDIRTSIREKRQAVFYKYMMYIYKDASRDKYLVGDWFELNRKIKEMMREKNYRRIDFFM